VFVSEEKIATKASPVDFVHLHNHSHYSLLDGLQKVPEMLDRIKDLGMSAVAITDHGTLSGAIEFYKEAKKRDIKPIVGLETYVAPRAHTSKEGKQDANPYHLILLAKNFQGYQNLMKLTSIAQLEGYYYKPRVDRELLEKYHEGLIALSACAGGEVASHIRNGNLDEAQKVAEYYRDLFGADNYYLELQDHEDQWSEQKVINDGKRELAKRTGIKLVVTADSHYCRPEDKEAHEILLCVQTGKQLTDADRMTMDMDLFVSDPQAITSRWSKEADVLANTAKIAEMCNLELELGKILIPRFEVPTDETEKQYLHKLCWQGLMWRYGDIAKEDIAHVTEAKARKALPEEIIKRADYELEVIGKMGYEGYFLIVADFINWGKNQDIIFGPGRGSAASSVISYALNITDLDPIHYSLMFERFLNPNRISMPDIDIDIQDSRRDEVISYVTEKYGQDRVAQIITFGTMAARNAVRDTGRVLGYTYAEVDAIAKLIPQPVQGRHIPLKVSIQDDPELKKEYENNPRAKRLIDQATKLEGTIRSNGVHAAGVVIAPEEIVKYTPLQRAQKGGISTQYSMGPIEELGLLKMDFLGLSNLTIIKNALRIIKKVYGVVVNISEIPMDDAKTFELLSRGDSTGVFQLESAGMKRYLRELKPSEFEDIIAMGALYRPGPMAEIPRYIEGKHHPDRVTYPHESLEPILRSTYGVMVYQEQIILLLQLIAGYSPGEADLVRKAIGKKKRDIMQAEEPKFIAGCLKRGLSETGAKDLWAMIQPFADYSFNRAHAACYGLIAYQTAYLKANYPAAYMAALMTSDHDNIERIAIEVAECKRMGIQVLAPDVNESFLEFGANKDNNTIRFGMCAIKNVGTGAIEAILAAREEGGPFTSVEDFAKRVNASEVNKKVWESLIRCGAMDGFDDRNTLLGSLDTIVGYASKAQKNALSGQIDIFGSLGAEDNMPALRLEAPAEQSSMQERLGWEKELLGLYLSRHPLDEYEAYMADKLMPIGQINQDKEGQTVKIGGITTTVRKIVTKNNATMAFVGLEDKTGSLELIVFPRAYEILPELWQPDQVIQVSGKVSYKDRDGKMGTELKIMVDKAVRIGYESAKSYAEKHPESRIEVADAVAANWAKEITISVVDTSDSVMLMRIKDLLTRFEGDCEVYLAIGNIDPKTIRLPFRVEPNQKLLEALANIVGEASVATVS
jgi:DNA polymerase III subunit alpha